MNPPAGKRQVDVKLLFLWLSQFSSAIGDRLHEIAIVWIAVEMIGADAGYVVAAGAFGRLSVGLYGGVIADLLDRRATMISADLLRALIVLAIPLAYYLDVLSVGLLAAVTFVVATLDSVFQPALQATLPGLIPNDPARLQRFNAVIGLTVRASLAIGPALTGFLLAYLSLPVFFIVDATTFLVSAMAIASLRKSSFRETKQKFSNVHGAILEGLTVVRGHPAIFWGTGNMACCSVIWGTAIVAMPLYVSETLGSGADTFGYLLAIYGVGNAAANLLFLKYQAPNRPLVMCIGILIWSLGWVLFSQAASFFSAALSIGLAATGGPLMHLMLQLMMQTDIADEYRGRVLSLRVAGMFGGNAVGMMLFPSLSQLLGASGTLFLVSGVAAFVAALTINKMRG